MSLTFRAAQVREWLYGHPTLDTESWTNLPAALRSSLADHLWPFDVEVEQRADKGDNGQMAVPHSRRHFD